jgi:integrase
MITLYKRGRVFWAQSNFHGVRKQWSLQTRDRSVAVELLRQAQLDELSGKAYKQKSWQDFKEEFLSWIEPQVAPHTYKEYARVLKLFSNFLANLGIAQVGNCVPETITAFTHERSRSQHRINRRAMTTGGIKFELRILHRVFAHALEHGYIARNPVTAKNLGSTSGKTLPFSLDEIRTMLECPYLKVKPYLKAIILLFLHTGLRISDVIHLQRSSIANGILHLKTKKRGTIVRLPLHPDVLAAIKELKMTKSPYVFTTAAGRPIVSLDKHLRRLWKACGISGGHAHRFRDTFAVNLLEHGATLYDVAKLLGISHQTAERHYTPYVKELQERGARLIHSLDYKVKHA